MIDSVVFDLGGVLIGWDPRNLYRKLTKDEAKIESFLRDVCHGEWNSLQDAGRSFAEAIRERSEKFPEQCEWIQLYQCRWEEMISGQIDGTVEILNELAASKRVRLLALTNWSSETFPYALRAFSFFKHFEGIVVSGDEKLIKPDPQFFQILLNRYQLDAKRCLFIDDVDRNVEAARAIGFNALLFSKPEILRSELEQLGLLKAR